MIWLLSAFVVLGIAAALLVASMWFGDRPSDARPTEEAERERSR